MNTHEVAAGYCLKCGKEMSAATNVKGEGGPEVGNVTVCLYCGHVMEFGPGLVLIELRDETIKEIAGDKDLLRAVAIAGHARKHFREQP